MNARDWLVAELEDELRSSSDPGQAEEAPWLDGALAAVIADVDLSDRSIDLLVELGDSTHAAAATLPDMLAADPSIAARREALGISAEDAARQIGVATVGYEGIERYPLRWLSVRDAGKVTAYLGRLGIERAVFLRWLASLRPTVAGPAWGYRPGATVDRPVEATGDDASHFLEWGTQLLRQEAPPTQRPDDADQLFGYAWSESAAADRAATILAAAQAQLLSTDLRPERPLAPAGASVIALDGGQGLLYPAFQFDEDGQLPRIVAEINATLDAAEDPWGVADWWLSEDPSLGARPIDLIGGGTADHDRLRRAARELIEG